MKHRILPGLPPYGPMYKSITRSGIFSGSEGTVVEIYSTYEESWIGNFENGYTSFSYVHAFLNSNIVLVISNGSGYLVDINLKQCIRTLDHNYKSILETDNNSVICASDFQVSRISANGIEWRSEMSFVRGIADLKLIEGKIEGSALKLLSNGEQRLKFTINSINGQLIKESLGEFLPDKTVKNKKWWRFSKK